MTRMRDPLDDDPPGTRDEREYRTGPGLLPGEKRIAGLCPVPRCQGGVKPVTPRAADGSRRFECNDPDCTYKARRDWDLYETP